MYTSKSLRRTCKIEVLCTPAEKRYMGIRARNAGLSESAYLREIGMRDSPARRKILPPEVLAFNGNLAEIAGALELIANRRLDNEDLDGLQRAELLFRVKEIKLLIENIKNFLK